MEYPINDIAIERIARFDKNRDGQPFVSKRGDPFHKVLMDIPTTAVDDPSFEGKVSLLDFDNSTVDWEVGTKVTGKVVKNGDFWNFELPRESIADLKAQIVALKKEVEMLKNNNETLSHSIEDDGLPF